MKELKKANPEAVFIIVMWYIPSNYLNVALKPVKGADISLFETKDVWKIHKAKKYTTIVYDKLGNSVWRYDHKGGPLYTTTWKKGVQTALDGIK